jgi:hypothetical protein
MLTKLKGVVYELAAPNFDAGQGKNWVTCIDPSGTIVRDQSVDRIWIEQPPPNEGFSAKVIIFNPIIFGRHPAPQGDTEACLGAINDFLGQDAFH